MEMASVLDTVVGYTNLITALTDHDTRSKSRHEMRTKMMAEYITKFLTILPHPQGSITHGLLSQVETQVGFFYSPSFKNEKEILVKIF